MDIQKEIELYKKYRDSKLNHFGLQLSDFKTMEEYLGCLTWLNAKSQAVPENPWVEFGFPELNKDESSDCLTSKEVFFELLNSGGTYHGWYIARPIDKRDQCCCEEEFEDGDVEYEYFFNANVGDELFDEDCIGRWMYVPNVKEQSHESN